MKKAISILLAVTLLLGAVISAGAAESAEPVGKNIIHYRILSDGTASITYFEPDWNKVDSLISYDIPAKIDNRLITRIEEDAFNDCYNLQYITIPETVRSVSARAFSETPFFKNSFNWEKGALYVCRHLISVKTNREGEFKVKDGTLTIGANAFSNCKKLTSIHLPDSVFSVGGGAFYNCTGIKSMHIPESVVYMAGNVFADCTSLETVNLPESLTEVPSNVFTDCEALKTVSLPKGVKRIGERAFYRCFSLEEIALPNGLEYIDYDAFSYCKSLKEIYIPDSVTAVKMGAFSGCVSLQSLRLSESLTEIEPETFRGMGVECTGKLKPLYIPDSVKKIGMRGFYGIGNPESIHLPQNEEFKANGLANLAFAYSRLDNVDFLDGVKIIPDSCFEGCRDIKVINIPDSVVSIGENAFVWCGQTANSDPTVFTYGTVTIPKSVKEIGRQAFYLHVYLYGYAGTVAQEYAESFDWHGKEPAIKFIPLNDKGTPVELGDVNADGVSNIQDATVLQKHIAKMSEVNEAILKRSVKNYSGKVTISDATAIQKELAKAAG